MTDEIIKRIIESEKDAREIGKTQSPLHDIDHGIIVTYAVGSYGTEAEKQMYNIMVEEEYTISGFAMQIAEGYCQRNGIRWHTMQLIRKTHIPYSGGGGHFVLKIFIGF